MIEFKNVEIFRIQIVAIAVSILLMIVIFELIRRKKLREKYSLIWFSASLVMILFSLWRDLLDRVALLLGVAYAPALLFLVAMFFGMILLIHFSIVISELTEKNKTLAQEIALLKAAIKSPENPPS